ncbi:MAG: hypothetical protein LBI54_03050 [Lachnospiraceae bacterium]|jgi:hypothetical protein|nr:hypothetical protein [Lachnospiraceae bacterium]
MLKELLKGKKGVMITAATAFAVLLATALYVSIKPADTVEANEAMAAETEQYEPETTEEAVIETEDSPDETPAYPETEVPEKDNIQETVAETDETAGDEPVENGEDEPNEEADDAEQPKYIGRQPPKGYVEPESLEYKAQWMLKYKDTYQSNIVVILDDLFETDHTDYAWFHPTAGAPLGATANIFNFLAYAILTYYDGDVPCDYYFYLEEDCHNMHPNSTKIFEVQTHGDRPLNICLDMYNYKIRVEEGIVERGLTWAEEHGG